MNHTETFENTRTELRAAKVTLDSAANSMRRMDYLTEGQRRELVAWLDDVQAALGVAGQSFQRLNERSAAKSPLANGAPSVILHEQGDGPK